MFRSWFGCFALAGVIVLLQLSPLTGIFLMMLAAPLWSAVLINLGFALIVVGVWRGVDSRWLLPLPILWFGGYAATSAVSHWRAHRFNAEIVSANADKKIAFDQQNYDVLIEPDRMDTSRGSALTPSTMISSFGLGRAYHVFNDASNRIQEYALHKMNCPGTMGVGGTGNRTWQKINDGGYGTGRRMASADNLCLFISFTRPERPVVRVRPKAWNRVEGLTTLITQDIEIIMPEGKSITLRSGHAIPLSWLPQPIIGCSLNSGQPAWVCGATFAREKMYDPQTDRTPNGPDDVVARALGLVKASIRERYSDVTWRTFGSRS